MINKIYSSITDTFIDIFRNNIKWIIILFILNLQYLLHTYIGIQPMKMDLLETIFLFILVIMSLLFEVVLLCFLISKLPDFIHWLIVVLSGIIFFVDGFTLLQYGRIMNPSMFQIILETNKFETLEYIELHLNLTNLAYFCITLVLIIVTIKLCIAIFNLLPTKQRLMRFFSIIFLIFSITSLYMTYKIRIIEILSVSLSIVRYGLITSQTMKDINDYQQIYSNIDNSKIDITYNNSDIPYVIFILGESTQRWHMQIYGYDKNTTPNLQRRLDNGEIALFTDVISSQTTTILSMQRMFTFYRNDSPNSWYNYNNLFDILSRGGYNTIWLSNQEASGVNGNTARTYANRCDIKRYTTLVDSATYILEYDEKILPLLDEELKFSDSKAKNYYTLHLMGTHYGYSVRYPNEFNIFNADSEPAKEEYQRQMQAYYDNAVFYNDFIVDEIIKRFEDKDALIFYVSDHGEDVYEDGKSINHRPQGGDSLQLEIPMLVWMSSEFKQKHVKLVERIFAARNQPFMTDDMIHAILDVVSIHTKDYDETKSLFSPNFDNQRKRIYDGKEYVTGKGLIN